MKAISMGISAFAIIVISAHTYTINKLNNYDSVNANVKSISSVTLTQSERNKIDRNQYNTGHQFTTTLVNEDLLKITLPKGRNVEAVDTMISMN